MEPYYSVGVMCLLSTKNVDISVTVLLLCFFPKLIAVDLRKGPFYEYPGMSTTMFIVSA